MEEKRKLIVLDRNELVFLTLFVLIMTTVTFTIGFRIGRGMTFKEDGFIPADETKVADLQSVKEEKVGKTEHKRKFVDENIKSKDSVYHQAIQQELNKLSEEDPKEAVKKEEEAKELIAKDKVEATKDQTPPSEEEAKSNYVGKYTIQLGSHPTYKEAEEFANGFAIRGYNPIINTVKLAGRGTWYRVSLGAFDDIAAAKEYIQKEESLFQGQNYFISEIK